MGKNLLFNPKTDNCTSFSNLRVMKFDVKSFEVSLPNIESYVIFTNRKPFEIYYNADTYEIVNVLEKVKLKSDDYKVKYTLSELIEKTDLQRVFKRRLIKII